MNKENISYTDNLASDELSIPDGRLKQFRDKKYWPDAYVVDGVAVYAAEGRTLVYVDENVEEFDVPEGVVNIYHYCFAFCENLKRIGLPSSLKRIGRRGLFGCVSLKEVIIPESVYIVGEEMLMNCASLEHITLPSLITEIPVRMFCNCRSLDYTPNWTSLLFLLNSSIQQIWLLKTIIFLTTISTVFLMQRT